MAKALVYNELFSCKALTLKEFISSGEKPYNLIFNKTLSTPSLFDNISLLTEHTIKTAGLEFDKICAVSASAIPYATNVATSFEKGILYINNECNDITVKDCIKGLKIEGGMNIDDRILLIETIASNNFYMLNVIEKIKKYGGQVIGVIIILNLCEGEYVSLVSSNQNNILPVLNLYDIFNYLENNNKIEIFYCERVKFYCEKITKQNIKLLLDYTSRQNATIISEPVTSEPVTSEPVTSEPVTSESV